MIKHLQAGRHVIVHTSRGLADASLAAIGHRTAELFGRALGLLARKAVEQTGIERLVVAGGDTSSHAARALGIEAVEMIAPLSPGAPWC
ncbi:MAG: nucleotide-binding domain containing protein, partial [Opitutaceae bacterium]